MIEGGEMMGNAKIENYPISSSRRQRIIVTVERMKEDNAWRVLNNGTK